MPKRPTHLGNVQTTLDKALDELLTRQGMPWKVNSRVRSPGRACGRLPVES